MLKSKLFSLKWGREIYLLGWCISTLLRVFWHWSWIFFTDISWKSPRGFVSTQLSGKDFVVQWCIFKGLSTFFSLTPNACLQASYNSSHFLFQRSFPKSEHFLHSRSMLDLCFTVLSSTRRSWKANTDEIWDEISSAIIGDGFSSYVLSFQEVRERLSLVESSTSKQFFCTICRSDLKSAFSASHSRISVNLYYDYTCYSQVNRDTWHFF